MFFFLILAVGIQRLWELDRAAANVAYLRAKGAIEFGAKQYPYMVCLHSFWLLFMIAEAFLYKSSISSTWTTLGWLLFISGQILRITTIRTLGKRWTTRVFILPGEKLVQAGLFRWIPHPNYLGVSLEIFGLPLIGHCWRSSIVFGTLNLLLLYFRIRLENQALTLGPTLPREREQM